MIYQEGSLRITGGSHVVTGTGTQFVTGGPQEGSLLTLGGMIGAVAIATIVNGQTLHLSMPFPGFADGVVFETDLYQISDDFTPTFQAPYGTKGEADASSILRRAMEIFDKAIPKLG